MELLDLGSDVLALISAFLPLPGRLFVLPLVCRFWRRVALSRGVSVLIKELQPHFEHWMRLFEYASLFSLPQISVIRPGA